MAKFSIATLAACAGLYALLFSPVDRQHLAACEASGSSSQECRLRVLGR